jgi:hypothetical protein
LYYAYTIAHQDALVNLFLLEKFEHYTCCQPSPSFLAMVSKVAAGGPDPDQGDQNLVDISKFYFDSSLLDSPFNFFLYHFIVADLEENVNQVGKEFLEKIYSYPQGVTH